jgi:hypothetical protein
MARCLRRSSRCLRVIQARLAIFHPDGGEMARRRMRYCWMHRAARLAFPVGKILVGIFGFRLRKTRVRLEVFEHRWKLALESLGNSPVAARAGCPCGREMAVPVARRRAACFRSAPGTMGRGRRVFPSS